MLSTKFEKSVSVEQIGQACKKAAEDLGLESKLEDIFDTKKVGKKEVSTYNHSEINIYKTKPKLILFGLNIGKKYQHILRIPDLKKDQSKDHIYIFTGDCPELVTNELYQNYRNAVLNHI